MRKLRQFQEFGHDVTFLIGTFTSLIGDPSDKDKAREQLTRQQVEDHAQTYAQQAFKILDPQLTRVRRNDEWLSTLDFADLGLPVFVKPARTGSSVGITKVSEWADLPDALERAFEHDNKALVEAAIIGREIECGVLESLGGAPEASLPAEIRLTGSHDHHAQTAPVSGIWS